jgi:hypothetical protein
MLRVGQQDISNTSPVGAYNAPAPPMFVFHGKGKKVTVVNSVWS